MLVGQSGHVSDAKTLFGFFVGSFGLLIGPPLDLHSEGDPTPPIATIMVRVGAFLGSCI